MKKNSILFANTCREDGWIMGALSFKCDPNLSGKETYDFLKDKLESPEIVQYVINDNCLEDDLFNARLIELSDDEQETEGMIFKFKETVWDNCLKYVFSTECGEEVTFAFKQTQNIVMMD